MKSYWHNVVDEAVETAAALLGDGSVATEADAAKHRALQAAQKAQRQALIDSLGASDQYVAGTRRVFRLVAQQLGKDRMELTPDQRATFDQRARAWMQRRKAEGHAVVITGVPQ